MVDLAKQANEKTVEQVKKVGEFVEQAGEMVKDATRRRGTASSRSSPAA